MAALLDRVRTALSWVLQPEPTFKRTASRRLATFIPQVEGFEERIVMTTLGFQHSAITANFYDSSVVVEVDLSSTSSQTITVDYATGDNSAVDGTDYTNTNGTLSFGPGTTSQNITIPLLNTPESGDVSFQMSLSNSVNASIVSGNATITLLEPPTVGFQASTQNVIYSDSHALLAVDLSAIRGYAVTVDYVTSNGSALDGTDYTATSGTLTFSPGETSKTISVPLLDYQESSNTDFSMSLSNPLLYLDGVSTPINAVLGTDADTVTIDEIPTVDFHTWSTVVSYNASAVIQADLSFAGQHTITVNYDTSDGTGSAGTDYVSTSGVLTIQPGYTTGTFTVPMLNRLVTTEANSDPTFSNALSSPNWAVLGTIPTDQVTILDWPGYVVDTNANVVLPAGVPINSFSNWNMSLSAQNGDVPLTFSWSFSSAPDAGSITGSSSSNVGFAWAPFTGAAKTDTVILTETSGSAQITRSFVFHISATDSPAWSTNPTSSGTWPNVIVPDQLIRQDVVGAGPYAGIGLVDGSAQTQLSLPSYNSNVSPVGLVYNSAVADPNPVFLVNYPLSYTLPSSVAAQLTMTNQSSATVYTGPVVYYDPFLLDPNDSMELALQATGLTVATGRYNYQIAVTAYGFATNYTGSFNFINGSTTPTTGTYGTASPFGPGWSINEVERLWSVTGGVIVQKSDGTSLWFASSGGSYTSPAGDFSTLTYASSVYTRTLPNGTKIKFNSSGVQTSIVDRNSNATTFSYNTLNQLTSVADMNGQSTTFSYNTSGAANGLASAITEPSSRSLTLGYTSGELTTIQDPGSNTWTYGYNGSNQLTSLKDPRSTGSNYKTSLTYNFAGQVSSATQPDSTTRSFSAEQITGLATAGYGSSGTPVVGVLAATALASYTDPNGQTWTEYTDGKGFGLPVERVDPLLNASLMYRDANGLPWVSADALGNRERLFFDGSANVTKSVYSDDSDSTAAYNSFSKATQVINVLGGTTTYAYDSNGNVTSVVDANSHTTTYAYNGIGLVTRLTDARGSSTSYQYDGDYRLTQETEAAGVLNYTQLWTYDSDGEVGSHTDENGVTDAYSYDNLGHVTTAIYPDSTGVSSTYSYTYDSVGNRLTEVTPISMSGATLIGATSGYAYDSMNRLTKVTDPMGYSTNYGFDDAGNLTGVINPLGNTTTMGYDRDGRLTDIESPISPGTSVTITYALDADGGVTALTNPLGHTVTYSYDVRHRVSGTSDSQGNLTAYQYDAAGNDISVTHSDTISKSISSSMSYDSLGLVTETIDPLGFSTEYRYDADNNLTFVDGNTQSTLYSYDVLDRVTSKTLVGVATLSYAYDHTGNRTQTTDPLGHSTVYSFDKQGRQLTRIDPNGTGTTIYAYNLTGWLTSIADPTGNTTSYAYNLDGWLTATTNPNGHTTTDSYNDAGELTATADYNGRTTTYNYNEAGWRTSETWVSGGYSASYSYDAAGEMTGAIDSASTYGFSYDTIGELDQARVSYPGVSAMGTITLNYGYDFGNRTSLSDNKSASIIYSYNDNSQLTALNFTAGSAHANVSLSYNTSTNDSLHQIKMDSGTSTDHITATYGYTQYGLTIAYADSASNTLPTFTYTVNNAAQVTNYTGPEGSLAYSYDHDGQLTSVTGSESYTYSFDANGNRNSSGYSTTTGNELTADHAGDVSIIYDYDGNLTSKVDGSGNLWTYSWDYRNRLTDVVETNGATTLLTDNLTYDVFNNLIGVKVNGTQQRWTVFDGKTPYMDIDSSGTVTTWYLTNPEAIDRFFARVATTGSNPVAWYLTDQQGSSRALVRQDGSVMDQINYDPFGNVIYESYPGNGDRFKFQGGEFDGNLSLYRFGARWEDPINGNWVSQDPISFASGDDNLYRFLENDPINLTDSGGTSVFVSLTELNVGPLVGLVDTGIPMLPVAPPVDTGLPTSPSAPSVLPSDPSLPSPTPDLSGPGLGINFGTPSLPPDRITLPTVTIPGLGSYTASFIDPTGISVLDNTNNTAIGNAFFISLGSRLQGMQNDLQYNANAPQPNLGTIGSSILSSLSSTFHFHLDQSNPIGSGILGSLVVGGGGWLNQHHIITIDQPISFGTGFNIGNGRLNTNGGVGPNGSFNISFQFKIDF